MTDLDIEIDVPDDDDLGSPVRVLNGDWMPPWLKAMLVLLVGALLAIAIAAFLLGRSRSGDPEVLVPPTGVATTTLSSAANSPAVSASLAAVQDWENFVKTGDLAAVTATFDPDGPQHALFGRGDADPQPELDFTARNLTEISEGDLTIVSMDMVVAGPDGDQVYPYDFVYRPDSQLVWTVVDRRSPGSVALPPPPALVESALNSWRAFTEALGSGDGDGVVASTSRATADLAGQVLAAQSGDTGSISSPITDRDLFDLLVDRSRRAAADSQGTAIIAMLDESQTQALTTGALTSWTQIAPDTVIASLEVAGEPVTTVPFVATAEGWTFDLVGALNATKGT